MGLPRPSLNVDLWLDEFKGDPDEVFLADGLKNGFQLIPVGSCFQEAEMDNYCSATNPAVRSKVEKTLLEELGIGNYVVTDHKPVIVSALGAVPKPDSEEVWLIHDCSQPAGKALNDYADLESCKYQTLDDAISLLTPGCYMAKIDLRHAYRSVHIHPDNYEATGLKWRFGDSRHVTYFVDARLPYGGRRAPGIFNRLTQAVKCMMARRDYRAIVVYLDDFLVIGATWQECQEVFECLLQLLNNLGFEINQKKAVPPTQQLVFLGILIDTISQTLSLPEDKLVKLRSVVKEFLQRHKSSKRQLQSLAGKLNWACKAVYGGRTFLWRILDAMNTLVSPAAKFLFTPQFFADLIWWSQFLAVFNGRQLFLDSAPVVDVQTDACYEAAGVFFN